MSDRIPRVTPSPTRRWRRSGGFTMIELLIVMAILAVIGAMVMLGYNGIARSGLTNQTRITLGNCASVLAEFDAKTGLRGQPRYSWKGTATPPTLHIPSVAAPIRIWNDF